MYEIYLVGQISSNPETYNWRKRVLDYFEHSEEFEVINPCNNRFSKDMLDIALSGSSDIRTAVTWNKKSDLLVSRDLDSVLRSDIGLVNLNHYTPTSPLIGSFFELSCYFMNPEKTVIGIFDRDPEIDLQCWNPFVRNTIDVWTKNDIQACELIEYFFSER